jgi:hypothetical protein
MTALMLAAVAASMAALPARAADEVAQEEPNYTVSVGADVLSAYVSKGVVGNDEPVFQPDVYVEMPYGFSFDVWANMNITDANCNWDPKTGGKWSEFDLTLDWTAPIDGPVSVTVGGTYFVYPQAKGDVVIVESEEEAEKHEPKANADGDYELFVKLAGDCILQPALEFYHDCQSSSDWYILGKIGHDIALTDLLTLGLGATVGFVGDDFAERYGSDDGAAFSHAQFDAKLGYAVTDAFEVYAKGRFSTLIDGDIRDGVKDSYDDTKCDIFYGGVGCSYTF